MHDNQDNQGKKPYETPELVAFGGIEALTGMQQAEGFREEVAGIPIDGRPYAS